MQDEDKRSCVSQGPLEKSIVEEATWEAEEEEDIKKIYSHLFEFREIANQGIEFSS